jgi:hypothetical protein
VKRAEKWLWCGLSARRDRGKPFTLAAWPVGRPRHWTAAVNAPLSDEDLEAVRTSVNRARPLGDAE